MIRTRHRPEPAAGPGQRRCGGAHPPPARPGAADRHLAAPSPASRSPSPAWRWQPGADGQPTARRRHQGAQALSFVVDVVNTYDKTATGDPQAQPQPTPRRGPRISGKLGAEPRITLPAGLPEPTQVQTAVLARGHGAPVTDGLVMVQYKVIDRAGKVPQSTWRQHGAPEMSILGGEQPGLLDSLKGLPIGSRVLQTPEQGEGEKKAPALTAVVDIVDQPTPRPVR